MTHAPSISRELIQRVTARRAGSKSTLHTDLGRARLLAKLLDSQFEIAGIKFGLDALVGLVPGIGDTLTTAAGVYPLWIAHKHNLGKPIMVKMGINLAMDWAVGLVPVLGDVADVAFKANIRNLKLLESECVKRGLV